MSPDDMQSVPKGYIQRIKAEEEARWEVRKELADRDKPETFRARAWVFFNTGFGLWLLSTVIVGLFGFLYTCYTNSRENERLSQKKVLELHSELSYRVSLFRQRVDSVRSKVEQLEQDEPSSKIESLYDPLYNAFIFANRPEVPIRPDLRDKGIVALFDDLVQALEGSPDSSKSQAAGEKDCALKTRKLWFDLSVFIDKDYHVFNKSKYKKSDYIKAIKERVGRFEAPLEGCPGPWVDSARNGNQGGSVEK